MSFEPDKFESQHKNPPAEPREQRQQPADSVGGNVINLRDALKKMIANDKAKESAAAARKQAR
jgi:non-homologous end joining protein Ku